MLDDERALHLAVLGLDEHHEEVLEAQEAGLVARNVHDLRPPRLVRTIGLEAGPEAGDLQEVEARAIRARHGADRPAIALEPVEPGLP